MNVPLAALLGAKLGSAELSNVRACNIALLVSVSGPV